MKSSAERLLLRPGHRLGAGSRLGRWTWPCQDHEVLTLARVEYQGPIKAALAGGGLPPGPGFEFFMPAWLDRLRHPGLRLGYQSLALHLVHLLWQIAAYRPRPHPPRAGELRDLPAVSIPNRSMTKDVSMERALVPGAGGYIGTSPVDSTTDHDTARRLLRA